MNLANILQACLVIVVIALWVVIVRRSICAVDRLQKRVKQVRERRQAYYPEEELHPLLRLDPADTASRLWRRIDEAGRMDSGPLSELPDAEDEKACPYYNRTGQLVCNLGSRSLEEISMGRWYGYAEWMQDIVSGKLAAADLEDASAPERKGEQQNEEM